MSIPSEPYEDMLFDAATEIYGGDYTNWRGFACGVEWGAGWMAALIGMGEAIRLGIREGRFSEEYWEYVGGGVWEQWRGGKLVSRREDDAEPEETWQDRSVRLAGR